ncbi:hypothetical protein SFRURICE_011606 [Spodoptera frugiperda]|nr:hypothetical protein SFRURICE_011606 [Spodoptera frugiperda]
MIIRVILVSSHTHAIQKQNNELWLTQRVALCGNRNRYTSHDSRLPSHYTNSSLHVMDTDIQQFINLVQVYFCKILKDSTNWYFYLYHLNNWLNDFMARAMSKGSQV